MTSDSPDQEDVSENFINGFPPEEFAARRAKIYDKIGTDAFALVQGAAPVRGFELFRQTNEFYYLCGVEIPQAYLMLDGRKCTATLFLPHSDSHAAGEGGMYGAEDADAVIAETGVNAVYALETLANHLPDITTLYTPLSPAETRQACRDTLQHSAKILDQDPWDPLTSREARFTAMLLSRYPHLEICDLSPILDDMRLLKSPREVAIMRRAGELCALALLEAICATIPGLYEYQLGAVADYVYRVNGAKDSGYRPIIANGANIWHAHYYRNDAPLVDGDLVLMDYAPDVCNYTSDIGRMWPVNGIYSPQQHELYGFMVTYHKAILKRLRPGVLPRDLLAEAANEMRVVLEQTTFSKPIYEQAARRTLEFRGHLSHPVGMAVHDVGSYFDRPLAPGLVIAIDPQMWIPEEKLYIRVEDTIVITADGVEILTDLCPIDLDEIEILIQQGGMLQQFPPIGNYEREEVT